MSGKAKVKSFDIAFRNLGRHRTKTVITVLAISIGIAAYLFIDAWLIGMNLDSRRNLVSFETGAAKIYSKAYLADKEDMPLYEGFDEYEPIIEKLKSEGYDAVPHAVDDRAAVERSTRDDAIRAATERYVRIVEATCRRYPDQWYNFYRYWK